MPVQSWFGFNHCSKNLGSFSRAAPILYCDNISATYLTSNPAYHACTKHIEIDCHFVRNRVAKKTLPVKFLSSKDQLTDIYTKPLVSAHFAHLCTNLNVCSQPLGLRGSIELNSLATWKVKAPAQVTPPYRVRSSNTMPTQITIPHLL
jgi:hypothetical protein